MENLLKNNAKDSFLQLFPDNMKSHITNTFLQVIRAGAKSLDVVKSDVITKALDRCETAQQYNDEKNIEKFRLLLQVLEKYPEETEGFILHCLAWESLPHEVKEVNKKQKADSYRQRWLSTQPATEKQIAYLRKLGWAGGINSKQHASELISRLTGGGSN